MHSAFSTLLILASDKFEGKKVYACQKYLEKTQWMRREELKKLQVKKLKSLLTHAFDKVPYYHESFKKAGFRPSDLNSLDDARKIPVLKKSTVRSEVNRMVARNFSGGKVACRHTSGTTGSPMKFYKDYGDWSWGLASEYRGHGWAGYRIGDKLGWLWSYPLETTRTFDFKIESFLKRSRLLNTSFLSEKSMAKFAETLHKFKPSFIRAYASALNVFANYLLQNDKYKIAPRAVFTSASTLLPHYRKAIEQAFNCKVYDYYGSYEVSIVAAECGQHEGLHVSDENVFLEIVENGEPIETGKDGKVLITDLHSYYMPFIRYDIGDSGKILPETCLCGRELSLMKPLGRTYEYFLNSDGSFTSLRDFATVFEDIPIREFQVIQESLDEIVVNIVRGIGYTNEHTEFIEKNIKFKGPAKITVKLVDSIPSEKSGKQRHIVSKISTKYG